MMKRQTSWCIALAFVAFAPVVASAADQCKVNDTIVGIWTGSANYIGGGPVGLTAPQVQVPIRDVILKPPGVAASASSGASASPGAPTNSSAAGPPRPEPKNDQQRLFNAVYDGKLAQVQRLLRSTSVDVNAPARSDRRNSLIDLAAGGAQPEIVRELIEHGARVRGPVEGIDVRPIAVAILGLKVTMQFHGVPGAFAWRAERSPRDYEATIRALLDAGADADGMLDPTHPDSALGELLSSPRFDGDIRIERLLLDHGAQLGASTPGGSPLAIAIANGRDDFLNLVFDGRHLDSSALNGALAPAVARHDATLVSRLLTAGASPEARDPNGHALLCVALMGSVQSPSIAMLLLQHGATTSADCSGNPPLNLAMKNREVALLLLDQGTDPNRADRNGATALNLVTDADHDLIDALLKHGARLGTPISDQRNMGMWAGTAVGTTLRAILQHQDYLATGLLRRDGLQGDAPCAATVYAATVGTNGTLGELLHRGADPNSMTQSGVTVLMTAAYHGDTEAVKMLLAQPQIQIDHPTPTVYNPERLLGYDEQTPPPRTGHRTALMYAAAAGNAEICKILIEHGANTREADAEGKTALDYAKSAEVRIELQAALSTR
jgi:uncharacterized protein